MTSSRTVTYEITGRSTLSSTFTQTARDIAGLGATSGQTFQQLSQRIAATTSETDKLKISIKDTAGVAQSSQSIFSNLFGANLATTAVQAAVHGLQDLAGGLLKLGGQSLTFAGNLEMTRGAMATFLGSTQAANTELAQLRAFSDKAPLFDTENTQKWALQLLGAGEAVDKLLPDLKALGAVVVGSGGGLEQLKEAALAYQQVLTAGKLQGQDALQFTTALVPIWKIIAEGLGVSTAKARELSAAGEITAQQFQAAFSTYAVTHFSDSMSKAGDSLQGLQAQIQSGWQNALTTFGQGLEQGVLPTLKDIANTLQDPRTLEQIKEWGIAAGQFVGTLWEGAKELATWAGFSLPELPKAPDYSALQLTTADISGNLGGAAANTRDLDSELAGVQSKLANMRDQQAEIDAGYARQTLTIHNQQAVVDAGYAQQTLTLRSQQAVYDAGATRQIDSLHEQLRLLDQSYQLENKRLELQRAGASIGDDKKLARDIFSSAGQAARDRLVGEEQRYGDLQRGLQQDQTKAALSNTIAGEEGRKKAIDAGFAARTRSIEAEKLANDQSFAAYLRDIEVRKQADDQYFASLIRGWERQAETLRGLQKDQATTTTKTRKDDTAEFQATMDTQRQLHAGTFQAIADGTDVQGPTPPANGLFTKIFGTPEQQQKAGTTLATNVSTAFTNLWNNINWVELGKTLGTGILNGVADSLANGGQANPQQKDESNMFRDIARGDWSAAWQDYVKAKSPDWNAENKATLLPPGVNLDVTTHPGHQPGAPMLDPEDSNFVILPNGQRVRNDGSYPGIPAPGPTPPLKSSAPSSPMAPNRANRTARNMGDVQGRAFGGPVSAGLLYQVNEPRREYFQPAVGGYVLPLAPSGGGNGGGSGGNTYNITVNGFIGSPVDLAQKLSELLGLHFQGRYG